MAARKAKKAKKSKGKARPARKPARKASGRAAAGGSAAAKELARLKDENRRLKERIAALEAQAADRPASTALGEAEEPTHPMDL